MKSAAQRLLHYVTFDTTSDEFSETCPSTPRQRVFAQALVEEMLEMGIVDAHVDEHGYVYGTVPGDPRLPVIGLIAHMDTVDDVPGDNIQAKVVRYTGKDVVLNASKQIYLRQQDYPILKNHIGKRLIVTDGTTLLGADDKAGIAEILTAAERLLTTRMNHATVRIAFTPDEEIGRGADKFDVEGFGADYAYTMDGGTVGMIEYENFNAAAASVRFTGRSIHPGAAKDKMVNSQRLAVEFDSMLPAQQRPEHTEGYEGFIHLTSMKGDVEHTLLRYIIRDHDREAFEEKKKLMVDAATFLNRKYGKGTVEVSLRDTYYNMRQKLEPHMYIVERAMEAMKEAGMEPKTVPIRGGTDGARLSYMGLLCPNLCTGGENYHGRFEFIPVEDMEQCTQMLIHLVTSVPPKQ